MQIERVKISTLTHPEKNTRIHTEKQINEFQRSVAMFGQIRPVVVDENNMILAGNGLVISLLRAGHEEADIYRIEGLTEKEKKKLMIADNKIFSLGIENLDTLNEFLNDMQGDLDIPGFDEEILKTMIADADEITAKLSEYGTLDPEDIDDIKAGAERKEAMMQKSNAEAQEEDTETEEETDKTDIEKFVTCPKCGEKIWL